MDSLIVGANAGVAINGVSGAGNTAVVLRSILDNNVTASVVVGAGGALFMSESKLFGSATAVILAGGTFTSFGDNTIQGTGTPGNTIPLR